jgi:regulator of sigma E protease
MIIIYAAVLLGILIFVHVAGHFLLAKLLGVKVLKFSLGFGPKILGKKFGDTEYLLSAVPLGGYVKMLGQSDTPQEEEVIPEEEKPRAYNFQPVWKRFLIVFSGPFFNLVFAAFVFVLIFMSGVPVPLPDIGDINPCLSSRSVDRGQGRADQRKDSRELAGHFTDNERERRRNTFF